MVRRVAEVAETFGNSLTAETLGEFRYVAPVNRSSVGRTKRSAVPALLAELSWAPPLPEQRRSAP